MREIKFRVWDLITKSYSGGNLWNMVADGILYYGNAEWENGVVQMYTGLKDKNGKDVYEGDIVSGKLGKTAEVKWLQEHCAFLGYCIEDIKYYYLECGNGEQFENIEVIGNIYENPELLQV